MKRKSNKLASAIRKALDRDERSLYAIAQEAGVHYQSLHPFASGSRDEITLSTASKLCEVLGLELKAIRKAK